jgi:hypothetical protein
VEENRPGEGEGIPLFAARQPRAQPLPLAAIRCASEWARGPDAQGPGRWSGFGSCR